MNPIVPYGLLAFGAIYIVKPDIFFQLIVRRGDGKPKPPMPEKNRKFTRAVGLVFVIVGLALLYRNGG